MDFRQGREIEVPKKVTEFVNMLNGIHLNYMQPLDINGKNRELLSDSFDKAMDIYKRALLSVTKEDRVKYKDLDLIQYDELDILDLMSKEMLNPYIARQLLTCLYRENKLCLFLNEMKETYVEATKKIMKGTFREYRTGKFY